MDTQRLNLTEQHEVLLPEKHQDIHTLIRNTHAAHFLSHSCRAQRLCKINLEVFCLCQENYACHSLLLNHATVHVSWS